MPSSTEAEGGMRLRLLLEEGAVAEPLARLRYSPGEARRKEIAGRQRIETLVKLLRPPNAVPHSMRPRIARALPDRSIRGNAYGVDDTMRIGRGEMDQ